MVGGKVTYSQYNSGSGNTVIIRDKQGREWNYFHMVPPTAKVGQTVKPGDMIGNVGSTGESTGPHLDIHLRSAGSGQPDRRRHASLQSRLEEDW